MRAHLGRHANARITFFDVWRMVKGYDLDTNNEHISIETYYRFLVQDVLSAYNKVLYLDSDLVVEGDVAELFDTELGDNLVAATRDVDYLANLNLPDGDRLRYTRGVLKLKDPYDYFQAGVLVLNTKAMRALHTVPEWLKVSQRTDFIYNDQDILNSECEGRSPTSMPRGTLRMTSSIGRPSSIPTLPPQCTTRTSRRAATPRLCTLPARQSPGPTGGSTSLSTSGATRARRLLRGHPCGLSKRQARRTVVVPWQHCRPRARGEREEPASPADRPHRSYWQCPSRGAEVDWPRHPRTQVGRLTDLWKLPPRDSHGASGAFLIVSGRRTDCRVWHTLQALCYPAPNKQKQSCIRYAVYALFG